MNQLSYVFAVTLLLVAAWCTWRYYDLKRSLRQVEQFMRDPQTPPPHSNEIDTLIGVIESPPGIQHGRSRRLQTENERLATVLGTTNRWCFDRPFNADGRVQFANPAAGKLLAPMSPLTKAWHRWCAAINLSEAWKRCQQTRQIQIEAVEIPTRRQHLRIIVIPDMHEGGTLILVQDQTQVRETGNRTTRLYLKCVARTADAARFFKGTD
ncbi:MAG: hypothetical protein IPJ31_11900 [Bacteroidetes bacterium]|nr:hypothetical protein [Bacteroidota bacterium]